MHANHKVPAHLLFGMVVCMMGCQMAGAQASISEKRIYKGYALQANDTIQCQVYFLEQLPYPSM
jgi:hypothetical protein